VPTSPCATSTPIVAATVAAVEALPGSGRVIGTGLDLSDRAAYSAFIEDAEQRLGALDILINNAGIMPVGPFENEKDRRPPSRST